MSVPYTEYTSVKNERFYEIIEKNIITVKEIFKKYNLKDKTYYHFDINAGIGKDMKDDDGSVLQFIKLAEKYKVNYYLICIEKNYNNYRELKRNIKRHIRKNNPIIESDEKDSYITYNYDINCKNQIEIINDDHNNVELVFNEDNNYKYGSLYTDPNGTIPSFDLLKKIANNYNKIDIIINLAATTIKRVIGRGYRNKTENLIHELNNINKDKWIIQKPDNKLTGHSKARQWVFLIGTKYKNMIFSKKKGFFDINSIEGKQILYELSFSKKEKQNKSYLLKDNRLFF